MWRLLVFTESFVDLSGFVSERMAGAVTRISWRNAVLLLLVALAFSCQANGLGPPRPRPRGRGPTVGIRKGGRNPNEKIFNVVDFGAKPDGKRDNAVNFIRAWRTTCEFKGPARLVIPKGTFLTSETLFVGPCQGQKVVQFIGNVKASTDLSSYTQDYWILFENIDGLVVTGTGTIDGQGQITWPFNDCSKNGDCTQLPVSIKFNHVTNGVLRQITSVNPMGFHISIVLCQAIRARNLHLIAPDDSPNTDGIHISQSTTVKVARSVIATGDDCIGIIQGSTDISVKKVTCGPGHGISVGSLGKREDEKDVKGITVKNCTLKGTDNGLRIKTWGGSPPSQASNFLFEDIVMNNVKNPIIIDQYYGSKKKGPSKVKISDVRYNNIRGTTISENAVNLVCSPSFPCQGVHLANINLKYTGPSKKNPFVSLCENVKVNYAGLQSPPPCR